MGETDTARGMTGFLLAIYMAGSVSSVTIPVA